MAFGDLMRRIAKGVVFGLTAMIIAACTAAEVLVAPDAPRVQVGTRSPSGAYEQIGAVTATHGGGCGLYGQRGNYEGADAILRNKAAKLGADYVHVLRVTEPHLEGICMYQGFVIDGMAYRLSRQGGAPAAPAPAATIPRGLNGTYAGEISGKAGGQGFTMRVTFTLVQSGNQIVGTWNTTGGASGTVVGVVEEVRVSDFRARQVNPCTCEFVGDIAVEGDGRVLRGAYRGSDCSGNVTAAFEAVRQE